MRYDLISQTHPSVDLDQMARIRLLYAGGYAMRDAAAMFLPRQPREGHEEYQHRIRSVGYTSYLGQIVDYFAGVLFGAPLRTLSEPEPVDADLWEAVRADADMCGATLSAVAQDIVTTALLFQRGWWAVDFPPAPEALSAADERAAGGGRPYIYEAPAESVIDWHKDESGALAWLVERYEHRRRETPEDTRDGYSERFRIWSMDRGIAVWQLWETPRYSAAKKETPKAETELRLVGEGATTFTRIPRIPLELPPGLVVGQKIGPLCEEHYQRRSELYGSQNRSLVEIPVAYLGGEIPGYQEPISSAQMNPARAMDAAARARSGVVVEMGAGDRLEYVSPQGKAFEIAARDLDKLLADVYRVVNAMALSVAASAGKSAQTAESKREDRSATEAILRYLGRITRDSIVDVLRCASNARNERLDWKAEGLDEYSLHDLEAALTEAERVKTLAIPSSTFRSVYLTDCALALVPTASEEERSAIRDEIAEGTEHEMDHEGAERLLVSEYVGQIAGGRGGRGVAPGSAGDRGGVGGAAAGAVAEGPPVA